MQKSGQNHYQNEVQHQHGSGILHHADSAAYVSIGSVESHNSKVAPSFATNTTFIASSDLPQSQQFYSKQVSGRVE
jgi:hypothetical protein